MTLRFCLATTGNHRHPHSNSSLAVSGKVAHGCHVYAKPGAWKSQPDVTYVIHHGTVAASNEWRLGVWRSGTLDGFDGNCRDGYRLYKSADGGRTWTKLYPALHPCPTVTAAPAPAAPAPGAAETESTVAANSERAGDESEIDAASESASDGAKEDNDEEEDEEEEESSDDEENEAELQDEHDVEMEAPGTDATKPFDGDEFGEEMDDDGLLPPLADSAMNDLLDQYLTDELSGGEDCTSDVESSCFPAEEITVSGCGIEHANGLYERSDGMTAGGATFARRTEDGGAFELYCERRGCSTYLFLARVVAEGRRDDLYFAEGGLSAISFTAWSVIADAGDVGPAPSAVEVGVE